MYGGSLRKEEVHFEQVFVDGRKETLFHKFPQEDENKKDGNNDPDRGPAEPDGFFNKSLQFIKEWFVIGILVFYLLWFLQDKASVQGGLDKCKNPA